MDAARAHPVELEGQFQSSLAYTCRVGGAAETAVAAVDLSRAATSIARVGAGIAHDRVVGCVEELKAKLSLYLSRIDQFFISAVSMLNPGGPCIMLRPLSPKVPS